jgi:hypothetical protein
MCDLFLFHALVLLVNYHSESTAASGENYTGGAASAFKNESGEMIVLQNELT